VTDGADRLIYFTHEVAGRLFPGWFRRIPGRRIEVFTVSRLKTEFIEAEPVDSQARRMLEELIRLDFFLFQPQTGSVRPRKGK
jgi:hypothetical protein